MASSIFEARPTVDQGNARTVRTTFANSVKISAQEFRTSNLQALFHHFGGKLVHAVLSGVAKNMVDGAATISRGTMLTNMLNAPIAELTVGDDVDTIENFVDAGPLKMAGSAKVKKYLSFTRKYSKTVTYLVFLEAILEDILNNKAASLA